MYLVNKESNEIKRIEEVTFKSIGLKERKNLQEYILKSPESLGEELLIIQKEFSGFDETNERLDLLALDKNGNLVVIENKLDDTGRDVVWQALKYASYCSGLDSNGIKEVFQIYLQKEGRTELATDLLTNFFNDEDYEKKLNSGNSQRIILVSGEFRKEVTSTVLWLLNFGLRIQCFKVKPYKVSDNILLDFNQIIPVKEAEDYMIKVASKNREEILNQEELANRHVVRLKFWTQFLREINKHNNFCVNVSPSRDTWIPVALGKMGVGISLVVTRNHARVEVFINRGDKEENKRIFDAFLSQKEEIEKQFGAPLVWERMDDNVTARIKWQLDNVNVFEESDYSKMNKFLIDGVERMKKAFTDPVHNL